MTRTLELVDARDARVEPIWRALEAHNPSYFLSWGWIACWLDALPLTALPVLAVVRDGGEPVAACFLGKKRLVRHHLFASRVWSLNATGDPRYDDLCIEHNALVHAPGVHVSLAELIAMLPGDWDEVVLPGIDPDALDPLTAEGVRIKFDRESPAPYVDLARVRATAGGYLALLRPNTRAQVRRARRAVGPLAVEVADDLPHAIAIFDELVHLHQRAWQAKGERGAFDDPWIREFHELLIGRRFGAGDIQLVRLSSDGQTIGCLYNFVYRGVVAFYQSGFAQSDDPHVKPGLLCHAAAIGHAAAQGLARYDFLAGEQRYKRSLATDETPLVWVRVQRPLVRFAVEDRLRRWKHQLDTAH